MNEPLSPSTSIWGDGVFVDAVDSHLHILPDSGSYYGSFSNSLKQYRALQRRADLSKAVVVQTKEEGTDTSRLVRILEAFDGGALGVAVVSPYISDFELAQLNNAGVRGVRFSIWDPSDAVVTMDTLENMARRITPMGWHIQLHAMADQIIAYSSILAHLPCQIVFDHFGRLPAMGENEHPAFDFICGMLRAKRAWMKLSAPYLIGSKGEALTSIGSALVEYAPDRVVWGSDWPHMTEMTKPRIEHLATILRSMAPARQQAHRVLVSNPKSLYGF